MMDLHLSTFVPLIVWALGISLATQFTKKVLKSAGIRHNRVAEAMIPFFPALLGALTGVAFHEHVGLVAVVDGAKVPWTIGAFYGLGVGFSSSGLFRMVIEWLPRDSKAREMLAVSDPNQQYRQEMNGASGEVSKEE